jgi:hypothetical protein
MKARLIIAVAVALGGCARTVEPPPSDAHPASPRAAEAPPPPKLSATLKSDGVAPEAPVAYTCSHHPSVMQGEPGECPICQMKLEPTSSRQTSPLRAAPPPADQKTREAGKEQAE